MSCVARNWSLPGRCSLGIKLKVMIAAKMIAVATLPQVFFDFLVGSRIQFAIQITIHQFFSFFAVHLFSLPTRVAKHSLSFPRARASRDITVPGGICAMSAISL